MMKKIIYTILFTFLAFAMSHAQTNQAVISGRLTSLSDGDLVVIKVSDYGYPLGMYDKEYKCEILKHSFKLVIPTGEHPLHIDIYYKSSNNRLGFANKLNRLALENFLISRGDYINLNEQDGSYRFNGKGSEKFKLIRSLNRINERYLTGFAVDNPTDILIRFKKQDTSFNKRIKLIESKKNNFKSDEFNMLIADCLGDFYAKSNGLELMSPSSQKVAIAILKHYKSIDLDNYLSISIFNHNDILKYSSSYTYWGLPEKYLLDSCFMVNKPFKMKKYFDFLINNYSGGLRERLLMNLLVPRLDSSGNVLPYIDTTLRVLKTVKFRDVLLELRSHKQPGAQAFDFALPDTLGNIHHFSDYKGNVVLLDFWFSGCGSCATAKPFLEKVEKNFKDQPVIFITINNDRDKITWIKSVRTGRYTSQFGINLFTEGQAFKHPISRYYNIDGGPYFILIGKNGYLTSIPEDPSNDNGQQLTSLIESELQK